MSEQPTTQPIEIPRALSDKLPDGGHYVRLLRGQKKAIDQEWTTKPRRLDDEELQVWIKAGNNYGVVGGFGLIIIDVDDDELKQAAQDKLPGTFTVQTPGHNGWHRYYLGSLEQPIRLMDGNKLDDKGNPKSVGEISAEGRQVVGPGSIHPNGKTYTILNDIPLAHITREQIISAFAPWISHEKPKEKEEPEEEENEGKKRGIQIGITKVFDCTKAEGFKQHGDQWQGAHPIHGSETKQNFSMNVKKNVWHCFRCDTGGGPLELLAVLEKIADCKDFARDAQVLKKNKQLWQQVKDIAIKKGIVDKDPRKPKYGPDRAQFDTFFIINEDTEKPQFIPTKLADFLMEHLKFLHFRDSDDIYVYDGEFMVYEEYGEQAINEQVRWQLQDASSTHRANEVVGAIKSATGEHIRHMTHKEASLPDNLIPFANTTLDINMMQPVQNPDSYFFTNRLLVKYDPQATCPEWFKFLESSVPDETDRKSLQQYLGLCMTTSLKYHKALFLIGPTHSGKSTFCKTIGKLFGRYCTNIPLQSLIQFTWERARLYGKFVNIFPDIPKDNIGDDSWFLTLLGNDYISGALKYHNSFDFPATCKHIYTANKLPKTQNHSDEFFIRVIIVGFPNTFLPGTPGYDPDLLGKLTTETELSGIVNWALQGLQEINRNKEITQRLDLDETRDAWQIVSDNISKFCITEVEQEEGINLSKEEIYLAYAAWCNENHEFPEEASHFFEEFRRHFAGKFKDVRPGTDKRKRLFQGLQLKKNKGKKQPELELPPKETVPSNQSNPTTITTISRKNSSIKNIGKEVGQLGLDAVDGKGTKSTSPALGKPSSKKRTLIVIPHPGCKGGFLKADVEPGEDMVTAMCEKCTSTETIFRAPEGWKVVEGRNHDTR